MQNIRPPVDAIKIDPTDKPACPSCENEDMPLLLDYDHRIVENPDKWRVERTYALLQCKVCGQLYYINEEYSTGETG